MPEEIGKSRLRLELPNGSVFEAEGSPEFLAAERREFFALQSNLDHEDQKAQEQPPGIEPPWETLLETHGRKIALRAKLRGEGVERDAGLILLAAARSILRERKPTAAQLARWLRASGYPVGRVDRAISASIEQGEVLSSGSRRARRYELSGPGLAKAFRLGRQHARFIDPLAPEKNLPPTKTN